VVSHPVMLNGSWAVFIVRQIVPPRPETFAQARVFAAKLLRAKRQRELKARFDREYTTLWRSKTRCAPDYVGPGCPQSRASLGRYEDPFSKLSHPQLSEQGVNG
jgi:hypothetical protein